VSSRPDSSSRRSPANPEELTALLQVGAGLLATAAVTALFWLTDLDVRLETLAYAPLAPHWPWGGLRPWFFLYRFGTIPGFVLGVASAVALCASFTHPSLARWRYPGLFLTLLLLLGPGLIINVLAKGFSGRPRPDDIIQLGGQLAFKRPFQPGWPAVSSSFLSGHSSMGYMFMGLFYLFKGWRRWAGLVGGAAFGLVQGVGRMLQGAHFASDVLLAGTVMFTVAAALSPIATRPPRSSAEARQLWLVIGIAAIVILVLVGSYLSIMSARLQIPR
jgi:lipid A 4'-phosphatase